MSTRDHLLLALLAPGSVEAAVGAIQEEIFRERGLVSAIALSPIVPLAFIQGESVDALPRGFLDSLDRAVRAPYRIRTTSALWREGALFLGLETGGVWESLRKACRARGSVPACAAPGRELFPAAEGFFFGCGEAREPDRRAIARGVTGRVDAAPIAFTSSTLAVVRITTPARGSRWWRDVSCGIESERPLRGKRA